MEHVTMQIILCGLVTGVGALPILLFKRITHRWMDILLAYTAGIMVAASTYGLIPASLKLTNLTTLCMGILLGAILLSLLEQFIPHLDVKHDHSKIVLPAAATKMIVALSLHNIPEGLSVGASFASHDQELGTVIMLSIGLQNAPEGFLLGLFLVQQQVKRMTCIGLATLTGIIEICAAMLGYHLADLAQMIVPYGLAFAAGAILFIVYKELIPETHGHGYERSATLAFIVGVLSMISLVEWL